jgi:hypothetical protein
MVDVMRGYILSAAHAATCVYVSLAGRMRRRVAWGTKPVTVHGMFTTLRHIPRAKTYCTKT